MSRPFTDLINSTMDAQHTTPKALAEWLGNRPTWRTIYFIRAGRLPTREVAKRVVKALGLRWGVAEQAYAAQEKAGKKNAHLTPAERSLVKKYRSLSVAEKAAVSRCVAAMARSRQQP